MPDEGSVDEAVDTIEPIEIQEEMERSFMDYAMSVITARALPDARDGLKPVHRRILYGMYEGGLRPDRPHRKSASAVGDVMGKYHPHGDNAIYDALARMAQDFSLRYPLVDGHGNFGSPDPNDRPAAMRYCIVGDSRLRTEAGTPRIRDLAELDENSEAEIDLKVLDHQGDPVRAVTLFHSGAHPTLRLRTREGYEITGTANHPLLCLANVAGVPLLQWRLLEEIEPGDHVVLSRQVASITAGEGPSSHDEKLALLAGAMDCERVPEFVWMGGADTKRIFLQALYEGDGSSSLLPRKTIQISYSTRSEYLARDVQRLLLEFGVISRQVHYRSGEIKIVITNRRDAKLFESNVGFLGTKQGKLARQLDEIPMSSRALSHDRVPFLADYLRREASDPWLRKYNVDRLERWEQRGREILAHIDSYEVKAVLAPLVASGYYYARVDEVVPAGSHDVYSVRVESDAHAFLADGFVNHNTEARLAPLAMKMLGEIDEETVDAAPTYDGQNTEPVVLPARFPNLLVNGVNGIAVGMATSIPPHNLGEVIDAAVHLIDNQAATSDDLMAFVKGPDFPTGGLLLGRAGLEEVYRTGRGSVKVRAVAEIEETERGDQRIVVSEVPYQTSVEMIGQKIAELVNDRQIDGVRDVRNESSGDTVRLVVDLKRDANAQVVLNQLYKRTAMQNSFAVHMLALVDGVPRLLNLAAALTVYVEHQIDVVTRRSQHRLDVARRRAHIVEGLISALDHIDAIIALIRGAEDAAAARDALMGDPFSFSEVQATHILDMQLRRLAQLEGQKLRSEYLELQATIAELETILGDESRLRSVIKEELVAIREEFGDARRTRVIFDPGDIDTLDLIEDEEVVVVLSHKGYVKTVSADTFRTQGRGGRGVTGAKLRDEDYVDHLLTTTAHSYLLFFSDRGRVYRIRAHEIPMKERTARGTALVNLLALQQGERIQAIIDTRTYEDGAYLFFVTRQGIVKKTRMSEYDSSLRSGLIALNLKEGDELVRVVQTSGADDIFMVSRGGMTIRFSEEDVRPMGRATAGVRGMRLKDGDDAVVSCDMARDDTVMIFVTEGGYGKRTRLGAFNRQGRGGQGVRGMRVTEERGPVVAAFTVSPEDEILVFSSAGHVVRTPASEVSEQGRGATGVRVASVAEGDTVVAVARVLEAETVPEVGMTDGDGEEQ